MQFHFQHFTLSHDRSTMKIGTDAVLLATLTNVGSARTLLDIGCGCGVAAFCLAQQMQPWAQETVVYGVDPDEDSILEAQENAARFGLLPQECFHFLQTPVQDFAQRPGHPLFDLIVSNPPFYHDNLKPERQDRLKSRHGDGQLTFGELADSVARLLAPEGRFALILPPVESDEFKAVAEGRLYCSQTVAVRPTATKPVYRHIREYRLSPIDKPTASELSIRDASGQYTDAYRALTKDFLRI